MGNIEDKVRRIGRDLEHAFNGEFGEISEEMKKDLAGLIVNSMEGRRGFGFDLSDNLRFEYTDTGGEKLYQFIIRAEF